MKPGFWAFRGAETHLQNQGMYLAGHKIDALPGRHEKLAGRKSIGGVAFQTKLIVSKIASDSLSCEIGLWADHKANDPSIKI